MFARLREWLLPLQRTPLHPQWLVFRSEPDWFRRIGARARGRVVDVGCGRQRVRAFLSPDCDYLSTDHPGIGVEWYGSRPRVFCDAAALPFADATVDTVLLLDVLEHVGRAPQALAEVARVLRPGGELVISVPFLYPIHDAPQDFRRWTRHGLEREAAERGLAVTELAAYGTGPELAALLANLALSRLALRLAERHNPLALLLLPLAALAIPLVNLMGRLLRLLDSRDEMAACGYRGVFVKRAPAGAA